MACADCREDDCVCEDRCDECGLIECECPPSRCKVCYNEMPKCLCATTHAAPAPLPTYEYREDCVCIACTKTRAEKARAN